MRRRDADDGAAPLIIVSAGRSGSTLLHELLARHERTAWLSLVSDRAPENPAVQRRVLRAIDLPLVGGLVRRRWPPDESWGFWNHHFVGFVRPCRDLDRSDVRIPVRDRLRRYFGGLVTPARPTLLLKISGWPRAGFLDEVLPGARFLHLVRDGREVARSLLEMPWWLGWHGPENWRFGPLNAAEEEAWARTGRSFAWLAGLQWRRVLSAAERASDELGSERWMSVRYEDLCEDPAGWLTRILEFAGLPPSPAIDATLSTGAVRAPARRWDSDLSPRDRAVLVESLREPLRAWGYG